MSFYASNVTIHDYRATPDLLVATPFTPNVDYLQPYEDNTVKIYGYYMLGRCFGSNVIGPIFVLYKDSNLYITIETNKDVAIGRIISGTLFFFSN